MHDRYDEKLHGKERSVEDIKDRFYKLSAPTNRNIVAREIKALKTDTFWPLKSSTKNDTKVPYVYDVVHEKNRKEQLDKFLRRTRKEIEEQDKLRFFFESIDFFERLVFRANEKRSERKKGEKEKREAEQEFGKELQ